MKQITNKKDLIGKTIKRYYESNYEFWIRFTDDSFVIFKSEDKTDGFQQHIEGVKIFDYEVDNTYSELIELGLITEKEHDFAVEEEEKRWRERDKKREENEKEESKKRELELLEQLKKKYEK